MDPHGRFEFAPQSGHVWLLAQQVKEGHHTIKIVVSLFNTPARGSVNPDFGDVQFGKRAQKMLTRHGFGAFSV